MNALDWVLILVVLLYAVSGYWQGFITGAFATVGLLIGGLIGVWLAPTALGNAAPSILVSLAAVFIVILCASLGQALFQVVGARIRARITWQPVRALDAAGGAALSAVAALLVAWALGFALSGSGLHGITPLVRSSKVLAEVNNLLPDSAGSRLSAFNDVVGTTFFPRYLEPFAPERIVAVPPGPHRMLTDPDVNRAQRGVVQGAEHQQVRPGHRGLRLRLRPRPRHHQRPRRGRGHRPDRRRRGHLRDGQGRLLRPAHRRRRDRGADRHGPTAAVRHRRRRGRDRDPRLPAERPLRRAGRPGPGRPAAALTRHLRARHGDPRRTVACAR